MAVEPLPSFDGVLTAATPYEVPMAIPEEADVIVAGTSLYLILARAHEDAVAPSTGPHCVISPVFDEKIMVPVAYERVIAHNPPKIVSVVASDQPVVASSTGREVAIESPLPSAPRVHPIVSGTCIDLILTGEGKDDVITLLSPDNIAAFGAVDSVGRAVPSIMSARAGAIIAISIATLSPIMAICVRLLMSAPSPEFSPIRSLADE